MQEKFRSIEGDVSTAWWSDRCIVPGLAVGFEGDVRWKGEARGGC